MNESTNALAVPTASGTGALSRPASGVRVRSRFYTGMAVALLATVLVGFAPTLYLRDFFEVPHIAPRVWIHGAALTAWFVALVTQAMLVATRRVSLHRRLGWMGAATGIAAVITSVHVTLAAVAAETIMARTVWSNLANALAFTVFLAAAVLLRRDFETHKRLILLASIAFVQPAVARIVPWPPFASFGMPPLLTAMGVSLLFLAALAVHDLVTRGKLHGATLLGGTFLIAVRTIAVFVVAASEWGRGVLRLLA